MLFTSGTRGLGLQIRCVGMCHAGLGKESPVPCDSRQSVLCSVRYIGHQLHVLSFAMAVGNFLNAI